MGDIPLLSINASLDYLSPKKKKKIPNNVQKWQNSLTTYACSFLFALVIDGISHFLL